MFLISCFPVNLLDRFADLGRHDSEYYAYHKRPHSLNQNVGLGTYLPTKQGFRILLDSVNDYYREEYDPHAVDHEKVSEESLIELIKMSKVTFSTHVSQEVPLHS